MNAHDCVARMHAYRAGRPLPFGTTRVTPVAADRDILIVAFLRMGGESAPWAIGFGKPFGKKTVLSVPEPRNRDRSADMVLEFAPTLLGHLYHPEHGGPTIDSAEHEHPARQVWMANESHVDMLQHLAYRYTFTKADSEERQILLRRFGRATNWLFMERQRPGQTTVQTANTNLTAAYTFPSEPVRHAHLGYLMAWLKTEGSLDARMAAAALAESMAISTSLDPALEREPLSDWLQSYHEMEEDHPKKAKEHSRRIHELLEQELQRRMALVEDAIAVLRSDKRPLNEGVRGLEKHAREEHWYGYLRGERQRFEQGEQSNVWTPSPETDRNPQTAMQRYTRHEEAAQRTLALLMPHDEELQARAIADGSAVRGVVKKVDDRTQGRRNQIFWIIDIPAQVPLRHRVGSVLMVAGHGTREVCIESIAPTKLDRLRLEVRVTGQFQEKHLSGRRHIPAAADKAIEGTTLFLHEPPPPSFGHLKTKNARDKDAPGAWLTQMTPSGPRADLPSDVVDARDDAGPEVQS